MADAITSHTWSVEHKELLCVLSRFFKIAGSQDNDTALVKGAERVLCHIFAGEAGRSGVKPWLTSGALRRMLYELHRKQHKAWLSVFLRSDYQDRAGIWQTHRDRLAAAAAGLGIRLMPRKKDHQLVAKQLSSIRRLSSTPISKPRGLIVSPTSPARTAISPMTQTQGATHDAVELEGEADRNWDIYHYGPRVAGRLAFRVWTPSSHSMNTSDGCYAGAYTGSPLPPPERSSVEFNTAAYNHLRPLPEPSNFLSITTSFLAAIRLGLWKGRTGAAHIAVIEMNKIANADSHPSRLTPSRAVINRLKNFRGNLRHEREAEPGCGAPSTPDRTPYPYNCTTKWIVWECIPGDAIVAVVAVNELQKFFRENPSIDQALHVSILGDFISAIKARAFLHSLKIRLSRRVGQAVGALSKFIGLDAAQTERLANNIKAAWNINKHASSPRVQRRHNVGNSSAAHLAGVFTGFVHGAATRYPTVKPLTQISGDGMPQAQQDGQVLDESTSLDLIDISSEDEDDEEVEVEAAADLYGDDRSEEGGWHVVSDDDTKEAAAATGADKPGTLEAVIRSLQNPRLRWSHE